RLWPKPARGLVVAQEIELRLPRPDSCAIEGRIPELFFCRDLDGYGWCVRKGEYLNVGLGRRSKDAFETHVRRFASWLTDAGKLPDAPEWRRWRGHAYLLAGSRQQPPAADGVLLVGDAAGLAAPESGEGIAPAIQSGAVAASTILAAGGRYTVDAFAAYSRAVETLCPADSITRRLRVRVPAAVGRWCLTSPRFTRRVIEQWFLRAPAMLPGEWRAAA
ncbi:MAG TPA: hypothetical protein VD833_26665, partial [Vicinamibacterales bacterium]|nr:hypothetical protein [Vicinamibacterales bacterium]